MRNRFVFAGILFAGLIASGCTVTTDTGTGVILTIDNQEAYAIDNIYISPSGFVTNDDLLGGVPLLPGDTITVDNFDCGDYDIETIDEAPTGNDCQLTAYNICLDGDYLTIDDTFFANATCTTSRTASHAHAQSPTVATARK